MARAVWMIIKWLVIPAALAATGYYIIGPRVGKISTDAKDRSTQGQPKTTAATSAQPSSYPAPDVNVKVGASSRGEAPHRRHHKKKPKPDAAATAPITDKVIPPDQATTGGDGAGAGNGPATTGGTDGR